MAGEGVALSWPVRWESAVRHVVDRRQSPEALLGDPRFAAHRVLDRLGALAHDVRDGRPGALGDFTDAVDELSTSAPWLNAAAMRRLSEPPEPAHGDSGDSGLGEAAGRPRPGAPLVDENGLRALVVIAIATGGWSSAGVILELAFTAMGAERWFGDDDQFLVDVMELGGMATATSNRAALAPSRVDGTDSAEIAHHPVWERVSTVAIPGISELHRCFKLLDDFMHGAELGRPELNGPLTWVTGIRTLDVSDPCDASPRLTIRGSGFGATQPTGVGVIVPVWDPASNDGTYRQAGVTSWADEQVEVLLPSDAVGGAVAFANSGFLAEYDEWNRRASDDVAALMRGEGCQGFDTPLPQPLWPSWSPVPPAGATATYQVAAPRVAVEVTGDPLGTAPTRWYGAHAQVQAGTAFWIVWRTASADTVVLRPVDATGSEVFQNSGQPPTGVGGLSGKVRLVAPAQAVVLQFVVEAQNAVCGTVREPVRIVVTGPVLGPVTLTVLQSLPGGDVDVVSSSGGEAFAPAGGRSIPLAAEKRTVVRIDWWPAIPQVPAGERVTARATLHVRNHEVWPALSGPLYPVESTAQEPSVTGIELPAGPPFSSLDAYQQWVADGNEPATFNVVLPASWCIWESILEAKVSVITPGSVNWDARTVEWVKFHRRRRTRIRYRRYTNPTTGLTATTAQAEAAIRQAASMLPIPDPEISVLGNDPAAPTTAGYIEDMMVERGGTPTPSWRDEIWLVIGPPGDGGVASASAWPWTGAAGATAAVVAHEIAHMFNQRHVALCGAAQDPEQPSTFPDMGNVVPIGWDLWNSRAVRNAIDFMSYCGNRWVSPERWRRIFRELGPPP